METNYIRWNMPNWITIFLMGAVGFVVLGFIASAIHGQWPPKIGG